MIGFEPVVVTVPGVLGKLMNVEIRVFTNCEPLRAAVVTLELVEFSTTNEALVAPRHNSSNQTAPISVLPADVTVRVGGLVTKNQAASIVPEDAPPEPVDRKCGVVENE